MLRTIRCPIAENYLISPDSIALLSGNKTTTFNELEQQVRFLVKYFLSLGLSRGNRVAILSENNPLLVSAIFALYRIEASAIFLSLQLTPEDWSEQLKMANTRLLLGQDTLISKLKDRPEKVTTFSELQSMLEAASIIESVEPRDIVLDNESAIIFTSSSTGHKKGVILSIENFTESAKASNRLTKLSRGDYWGVSLPMYHVGGLGKIFRTLFAGASSNFLDSFSPERIISELSSKNLTHLSLVPTVLNELISLAEDTNSLETLKLMKATILAGAASSEALLEKIINYDLPVLSAWGMTETTAHCTCMSLDDPRDRVTTGGKPFHHTSLRLINDDGEDVSEEGEILVKGPTVCRAYLDALMPQPKIQEGWLYTGDLGSIDNDGYLTIRGRKDDMFISGGENIHAGEIESVVKGFWKIKDAAVIPVPHIKWGHRPIVILELKDDAEIDLDELRTYLSDKIAKIKIPDKVISVKELPRTAIGKVDYKALKKVYT